ncbi:MAG TPA: toll/interleukin-1 receptor domain-containing protein [Sedimentisphaerales bacterium]|nr:toll/interleukin-1 receptor domain-containing protein [Sedimentisphaerales bacterium]
MKPKLFISYSSKDETIVSQVAQELSPFAEIKYWSESKELGQPSWQQIDNWISQSEATLVLITGNTVNRGLSVGKEVGISRSKNKKIIPFVSKNVPENELGFLEQIAYERIDLDDPQKSIEIIVKNIKELYQIEEQVVPQQQMQPYVSQEKESLKALLAIAAIVVAVLVLSKE